MPFPALLSAALVAAHLELFNPVKNREVEVRMKTGGKYFFKYATLDQILSDCRPALARAGLALLQEVVGIDGVPFVHTHLIHSSGESYTTATRMLISEGGNAQEQGSAISYARRYAILAILCLSADEDDDGNAASKNDATPVVFDHVKAAQKEITGQHGPEIKRLHSTMEITSWEALKSLSGETLKTYVNCLQAILKGEPLNV
jgi:hypothetical protein